MCVHVLVSVCVCVCACVCMSRARVWVYVACARVCVCVCLRKRASACVCLCLCVRARAIFCLLFFFLSMVRFSTAHYCAMLLQTHAQKETILTTTTPSSATNSYNSNERLDRTDNGCRYTIKSVSCVHSIYVWYVC